MPMSDDELERRIRTAAPRPEVPDDALERLGVRKRRRATARKVGTIATVVVVLAGTLAAFAIVDGHRSGPRPLGEPTPTAPPENFGLAYPICHVSTMPVATGTGEGLAVVFTREADGCPKQIQDATFVGVDVDGDRVIDATSPPVPDCFTQCEAFAAPDMNGDGIAEVLVSTAGADGYGIWPYAVTVSPPAIAPITEDGDPFGFAWVNVATHSEAAHCEASDTGQATFVLDHAEWDASGASVLEESFAVDGTVATKLAQQRSTVPLDQAPVPTDELCGVPVHGSAAGAMGGPPRLEGRDIGLASNVCRATSMDNLNLVPDGTPDTAFVGFPIDDTGRCPRDADQQRWIVAVDVTGDGTADASTELSVMSCPDVQCAPLGGADLDADGDDELVVTSYFSIHDEVYFSVDTSGGSASISPILVAAPGHPAAHIAPGKPLQTAAGGDEGYGAWIRCEGYPSAPILVFTYGAGVVDSNQPTEWHEIRLQLQSDGMFHVVGATDLSLPPTQDPGLVRSTAPACGLDFRGLQT
jgi:hypothetical protein